MTPAGDRDSRNTPGGDVTLREVREDDLDAFFAHQSDPAAGHMAAFLGRDPHDREAFVAHWDRLIADPTIVVRTIVADHAAVGHIARFWRDGRPEITYWIDRAAWGRGIATRALGRFLDEIRDRPLYASAAGDNLGSIRVLEKCGFVRTGEAKAFARARGGDIVEVFFELHAAATTAREEEE